MLLQTFVQLNILLLAAPALAHWSALPLSTPLLAHAARAALTSAAPDVEERHAATNRAAARSHTTAERTEGAGQQTVSATPVQPLAALFQPFPHAARAP